MKDCDGQPYATSIGNNNVGGVVGLPARYTNGKDEGIYTWQPDLSGFNISSKSFKLDGIAELKSIFLQLFVDNDYGTFFTGAKDTWYKKDEKGIYSYTQDMTKVTADHTKITEFDKDVHVTIDSIILKAKSAE